MSCRLAMDSDLVGPAGNEPELQKGAVGKLFDNFVPGDGWCSFWRGVPEHDAARKSFDGQVDDSASRGESAVDDAQVFFLVCVVVHLAYEFILDIWVQCEYNYT